MLRKILLTAVAAVALLGATVGVAHAAKALAMTSGGGWGWAGGPTQSQARTNAILQCELSNGPGRCYISTAEGNGWYFAGVTCASTSYTAASPQGYGRAEYLAYRKAEINGDWDCYTEVLKY